MHIFHIPSWYPSGVNSNFGIFIKEEIEFLSRYTDIYNSVAVWGQERCLIRKISYRNPLSLLSLLKCGKRRIVQENERMVEIHRPVVYWSHRFFSGNIMRITMAVREMVKKAEKLFGKADIIHAHVSYPAGYVAMILSEELKIPFILSEHMGPFPLRNFVDRNGAISDVVTQPIKRAKRVITVSSFLAGEVEKKTGIKSVIIPNPVNEKFFECSIKNKKSRKKPFTFLFVGSFTKDKGFDLLVESVKILSKETDNFTVISAGDKNIKRFHNLVSNSLRKYFKITGIIPHRELPELLSEADALVHPSRFETFGLVVAEALACGKPVVVTKCGGPEELVEPSMGYVVDKKPENISEAMKKIKNNYTLFDPEEISRKIKSKFHPEVVTQKMYELYREVVEETGVNQYN